MYISLWQLSEQLLLYSQTRVGQLPLHACHCYSMCMLLQGVVCSVYGLLHLLCKPGASADSSAAKKSSQHDSKYMLIYQL